MHKHKKNIPSADTLGHPSFVKEQSILVVLYQNLPECSHPMKWEMTEEQSNQIYIREQMCGTKDPAQLSKTHMSYHKR